MASSRIWVGLLCGRLVFSALALWVGAGLALRQRAL